jgi:hypothetical protein
MIQDYFELSEVFCPEVCKKYGDFAWQFFDIRLLIVMESIRMRLNKPIYVNDYSVHGKLTQRGFRCVQCALMKKVYSDGILFTDPHSLGKAWDFDIEGLVAEEVRQYLISNKRIWPYSFRLEDNVSWVHLDILNSSDTDRVSLFNK